MSDDRTSVKSEIWLARLDPTEGHEPAGTRPILVVSGERYNHLQPRLRIVLPLTTRDCGLPFRVRIDPPVGGVRSTSFIICEQPRTILATQLVTFWGTVPLPVLDDAKLWVTDFLND